MSKGLEWNTRVVLERIRTRFDALSNEDLLRAMRLIPGSGGVEERAWRVLGLPEGYSTEDLRMMGYSDWEIDMRQAADEFRRRFSSG